MADVMQQYGNQTTFNLESVLAANLASSRYSAGLERLSFDELLEEMYDNVRRLRRPRARASLMPLPRAFR